MNETATTILQHLSPQGAGGLRIMLSAGPFIAGPNSVQFRFKGSRTINHAQVVLNGRDTYDLTLRRIGGKNQVTAVSQHQDLYAEDLRSTFEQETGLTTVVPRITVAPVRRTTPR